MKNKIRRLETFSFFNHTGIREHLEKMAQKGWMIEKLENFGWVYRCIEPKNVSLEGCLQKSRKKPTRFFSRMMFSRAVTMEQKIITDKF